MTEINSGKQGRVCLSAACADGVGTKQEYASQSFVYIPICRLRDFAQKYIPTKIHQKGRKKLNKIVDQIHGLISKWRCIGGQGVLDKN